MQRKLFESSLEFEPEPAVTSCQVTKYFKGLVAVGIFKKSIFGFLHILIV